MINEIKINNNTENEDERICKIDCQSKIKK